MSRRLSAPEAALQWCSFDLYHSQESLEGKSSAICSSSDGAHGHGRPEGIHGQLAAPTPVQLWSRSTGRSRLRGVHSFFRFCSFCLPRKISVFFPNIFESCYFFFIFVDAYYLPFNRPTVFLVNHRCIYYCIQDPHDRHSYLDHTE